MKSVPLFGWAASRLSGDDHAEIPGIVFSGNIDEYLAQQSDIALASDCGSRFDPQAPRDWRWTHFDQKPILLVDIVITLAINIVVAMIGYYLIVAWGLLGG